jgi:hypothetical protein
MQKRICVPPFVFTPLPAHSRAAKYATMSGEFTRSHSTKRMPD